MSSSQTSFVGNIRTSLSDWSFSRSVRKYSKATLDHMFLDAVEHLDYSKIHLLVAHDKDVVLRHSEAITKSTEDSPPKIRNLVKAFDFGDKIPAGLVLYAATHNHVNWTQQLLDAGYPLLRGNASVPKSAGAAGSSEVILSFKSKDAQYIAFLTAIVAGQEKCVLRLLDAGVDKHKFERPERFLFSQRRSMNDAVELPGTGEILNLTPIETACLYGRVGILDCLLKHAEKRVDQKSIDNALTLAVKRENSAIYRSLVDAGANIDHSEGELLRYAIKDRSVTRTAFLLQEGVNVRDGDINVANTMIREPVRYRDEIPIVPQDAMEEEHLWQFADGVEIPAMQVAHRQGQNTPETSVKSFLIVALTALDDAAKVPTYLPTSTPRILKTDAFHSIPNSERNYLTSIGVNASLVATVIADYDTAKATKYLGHLVSNDIKRVEETKGLTYSRYLRGIREQTMPFLDFRDVIREFSEVIILPALICDHFARLGSLPHQGELNELSAKAKSIAANYIVQDKNTLALMVLNAKWHRAGNRCPDDIRPYSIVSEWSPLFEEAVDLGENYSIVCLRNAVQLKDEGSALSHCVGGYSSACQSGKTQILSLKYNGVSRATIELTASQRSEVAFPKGSTWAKMQFKGRNNSNPSPQDEAAFERFKYLVQDGKVEENKRAAQIAIRNMQISGLGIIERTIGFDLRDFKSVRERALAHYDQRVVVEGGGKTYTLLSTNAKARLDKWFASLKGQDSQ